MLVGEILDILMFAAACAMLMLGFPVAFTLAGVALIFAILGIAFGVFDWQFVMALTNRIFGNAMWNEVLIAVPLFVFMGVMLERSKVAEELLETMGRLFGRMSGGVGLSVAIVGMLLAASTGIVGATVVTMGLMSLPTMIKHNYDKSLSCGMICAAGTLGQIIPPSIVLVILGDQLANAYVDAQRNIGNWSPEPLSVGDLFAGALIPGLVLVGLYIAYQLALSIFRPESCPPINEDADLDKPMASLFGQILHALLPPIILIVAVLGSILSGVATPTEAASVGGVGAILLAGIRVKELNMPFTEFGLAEGGKGLSPLRRQVHFFSCLIAGLLLGAILGKVLFEASIIGLIVGMVAGTALGVTGILANLLSKLASANLGRSPIYAAALALVALLILHNLVDLRLNRVQISGGEWLAIFVALANCLVLAWGILVSLARVWATGVLQQVNQQTMEITAMVFVIVIGAAMFSLVFRGLGGEEMVHQALSSVPGGIWGSLAVVMLVIFVLGFFLDFIEITFVVVPMVAPVLLANDVISPLWLGILIAMNLQTSFLTPPFGFALFYLRGVAPPEIKTTHIYRGVIPFICLQLVALGLVILFPAMAEWLPEVIFGTKFN